MERRLSRRKQEKLKAQIEHYINSKIDFIKKVMYFLLPEKSPIQRQDSNIF